MKRKRPEPWQWPENRDGYRITVDVIEAETGAPIVAAVRIERPDGAPVSARDVRRLPLASVFERAKAATSVMFDASRDPRAGVSGIPGDEIDAEIRRRLRAVKVPRGGPGAQRSERFYAEILQAHRELLVAGVEHPNVEIARRKRVPRNTVDQWLYRARRLDERRKG